MLKAGFVKFLLCLYLLYLTRCFLSVTVAWRLQQPGGDWQIQDTVGGRAVGTVLLQTATVHCGGEGPDIIQSVYVPG